MTEKSFENKKIKLEKGNIDNMSELIDLLNDEITNLWNKAKNTDNMEDIVLFANQIEKIGKNYKIHEIENYGAEILKLSKSFDIENVMVLLNSFTKIKKSLQEISII